MAVKRVRDGDSLVIAIENVLEDYSKEVQEIVVAESREVAKDTVKQLKETSPKRTGKYASGWTYKQDGQGYIIYNAKKPQLTHLLEFPHRLRNGNMSLAKPHILPAEEFAAREYENRVVSKLERG